MISMRENVSDIGITPGLCLGLPAMAGVRSKRGAVHCHDVDLNWRLEGPVITAPSPPRRRIVAMANIARPADDCPSPVHGLIRRLVDPDTVFLFVVPSGGIACRSRSAIQHVSRQPCQRDAGMTLFTAGRGTR
jgi:hypothetical protein